MCNNLNNRRQEEGGYILVMALLVVGLISFVGLGISDNLGLLVSRHKNMQAQDAAQDIQNNIFAAIYNNDAWQNQTSGANQCQKLGAGCNPGQAPQTFDLRDSTGTLVNTSTSTTAGFTVRGSPCNTFNSTTGDDACPIRYVLTWAPVNCQPTGCNIEVVGELNYLPQSVQLRSLINTNNFAFRLIRGRENGSLQSACSSAGGIFDQYRNLCRLQDRQIVCPDGQYLVQATSLGQPSCRPLLGLGSQCPSGSAAIGILPNGELDCRSNLDWKL